MALRESLRTSRSERHGRGLTLRRLTKSLSGPAAFDSLRIAGTPRGGLVHCSDELDASSFDLNALLPKREVNQVELGHLRAKFIQHFHE
jgi:hypothetical protein